MIKLAKNREEWDKFVKENGGHPLQLWGWGELKVASENWSAHRLLIDNIGGAQVLIRKLPKPFKSMAYIPRGPVLVDKSKRTKILDELAQWAREQGSIELKIEPDWTDTDGLKDWKKSKNHILVARTLRINLQQSEEELLAGLRRKTRYSVRKSQKSGVNVRKIVPDTTRSHEDLKTILEIYNETANRAGFSLHKVKYYLDLVKFMGDDNQIYLAEKDGEALAFTWTVRTPAVEFWLYGGANDKGRELEANYALNWQAILYSREAKVAEYDMNGLLNDGISTFKSGFTEDETQLIGTYDKPLSSLYGLYEKTLPAGKAIVRKFHI